MKRLFMAFGLVGLLSLGSGCCMGRCGSGCDPCATCPPGARRAPNIGAAMVARGRCRSGDCDAGPAGPPTATVTYPYYTIRGPRDFLNPNPGGLETY